LEDFSISFILKVKDYKAMLSEAIRPFFNTERWVDVYSFTSRRIKNHGRSQFAQLPERCCDESMERQIQHGSCLCAAPSRGISIGHRVAKEGDEVDDSAVGRVDCKQVGNYWKE
jgi:hypothetical protein